MILVIGCGLALAVAVRVLLGHHAAGTSYAQATAYVRQPLGFVPKRNRPVGSEGTLRAALSTVRSGDRIVATRSFSVDGEFVISAELPAPGAVIDLGTGPNAVRFRAESHDPLPAVWIHHARNLILLGGDVSNPHGGDGVDINGPTTRLTWWGLSVHDVGGSGIGALPGGGPIAHVDLEARVTRWGMNPALDPHREKGTGFHAAILADVEGAVFNGNRVAIDASHGPGDAIEIGNPTSAGEIKGNTIILSAKDLYFDAKSAVAGNGLQLWGRVPVGARVTYLVTHDTQGRAVDANGVSPGVSMGGVRIEYGRAFSCCRNPSLDATEPNVADDQPWDPRFGVRYGNVDPPSRKAEPRQRTVTGS